jgi:co-chaperonin GroES (HSP10)
VKRSPLRRKGKSRFPKRRDPAYLAWIRLQPCCICGQDAEPHHVVSQGAGGDDVGNVLPLCRHHHQDFHNWGIWGFEARWKVDCKAMAIEYAVLYATECPESGPRASRTDDHPMEGEMTTIEIAPGIYATVTKVLGDRVLLQELPEESLSDMTAGGLYLPDQAEDHQRLLQGEILAVGEDVEDPTLLPGLRVICGRWSRVPLDQHGTVWVCSEDAIQAIISG